jgi:hypothetical protein
MEKIRRGIHTETVFELIQLDDRCVPVDVDLDYDPQEPHAIRISLALQGSEPVKWVVGRELLSDGLITRTGDGDVRVMPLSDDAALMEFRSADGEAWFRMPSGEIAEFLQDTFEVVPRNRESEWIDLDDTLSRLPADDSDLGELKRRDR